MIRRSVMFWVFSLMLVPSVSFAQTDPLRDVYERRPDLQAAFDPASLQAIPGSAAGFLIDLEDWARQYGWRVYKELSAFAPAVSPVKARGQEVAPSVGVASYVVIDQASGAILAADHADTVWPIASITKLVTAKTALDDGLDLYTRGSVKTEDDVGGAKVYVDDGTMFTGRDLLYATLVGSANNTANALARLSGLPRTKFIDKMNAFADSLNLPRTQFVDPTGIELGNVSTAREVAAFAGAAFENERIRAAAGSPVAHIAALNDDYVRDIKSTNWLLYDPAYDDLYVTAGKTGYLNESGWNLVVEMHPMNTTSDRSVLIVIFGAAGRRESFDAASRLAHWAWREFDWERSTLNLATE